MKSNRARGICLGIVAWLVAAVSVATAGEIKITKRYLLLPIDENGRGASVALVVDGREVRYLGMRLAVAKHQIDWWAFLHIAEYKGKTATLRVTGLSNAEMKLIRQADRVSVPFLAEGRLEQRSQRHGLLRRGMASLFSA